MDPDKFQMRDMKRRLTRLEDQIGYLKTDLKRQTQKITVLGSENEALAILIKNLVHTQVR